MWQEGCLHVRTIYETENFIKSIFETVTWLKQPPLSNILWTFLPNSKTNHTQKNLISHFSLTHCVHSEIKYGWQGGSHRHAISLGLFFICIVNWVFAWKTDKNRKIPNCSTPAHIIYQCHNLSKKSVKCIRQSLCQF